MKLAQGEFKELNKALKGIDFSSERYEFQFMPSKKYRNYYEMIMDDFNVTQGESLFSGIFHEAHKDVIEELFEQLEETMIMSDMGVETSVGICEELRKRIKERGITDPSLIMELIQEIVAEMMGDDTELDLSSKPSVIMVIGVNGAGKRCVISLRTTAKRLLLQRQILSVRRQLTSFRCGLTAPE